jgi:3'-5' exoribonuclease
MRNVVIKLSELVDGQEATCFAALVKKSRGMTKSNQPYVKCLFRDKRAKVEAPLWSDHPLLNDSESWTEGNAYRLLVRGRHDLRYGMQMDLLAIRPATDQDARDGFDFSDLVESSRIPADELLKKVYDLIQRCIDQPALRRLVEAILEEQIPLLKKMPAAQGIHHSYTGGLLEHIWSMTRIASFVADHYAKYYDELNPPLDRGVVIAAAILHDIGKLRELEYHAVEAKYTKEGYLIGHILMGRDMIREAAKKIEGFPEETLMLLEHAVVAHHGKREFGSPVLPQTMEALLVSYIDELDAKMNSVARERMTCQTADAFTDRIFALENRRFYKGIPEGTTPASAIPPLS